MTQTYRYPKEVDLTEPLSPELIEVWDQAMEDLKRRRNKWILWLLIGFAIFAILVVSYAHPIMIGFALILASPIGLIGKGFEPSIRYSVSDDQSSARFLLGFRMNFKSMFWVQVQMIEFMKTGCFGAALGLFNLLLSPVILLIMGLGCAPLFFDRTIFLTQFRDIDSEIKNREETIGRDHVRGTEVLPPTELAGDPPHQGPNDSQTDEDGEEELEALDGKLTLYPDGSLAIIGGASFDVTSTFENLSMGDLVLTRKDAGLLRVHYEGEDHAFFYNGSEWSQV